MVHPAPRIRTVWSKNAATPRRAQVLLPSGGVNLVVAVVVQDGVSIFLDVDHCDLDSRTPRRENIAQVTRTATILQMEQGQCATGCQRR
jgi:hypothetical protein